MKTIKLSNLLFFLPLLAMLWGCDSESDFPSSEYPLLLSAEVEDMSAPVLRSTANIGDAGISVSGGTTYPNAKYAGTGGTLTAATQGYWGSANDISIYGYAPYQASAPTSLAVKTDQSADTDYAASDFLYASPAAFAFADRNAMSLTFKHHLSKINLTLVAGDGVSATELATALVQITGTNTEAAIDIADGTLTVPSNAAAIIPYADGANKYKAIVVPQTVAAGTSLFGATIETRSFGYTLPALQEFKAGEQYNYTLTLSQGGITVSPVEITKWTEEVKDPNGVNDRIYRVGDYYPDPDVVLTNQGEKDKIQGLVFWIDPTGGGRHGKIVSLDEGTNKVWGEFGITTNATSPSDGKANMATIANYIQTNSGKSWDDYPAFKWCADKGADWYLPARDELKVVYNNKVSINDKLDDAGGTKLENAWYWSSSEKDGSSRAWVVGFNDGLTSNLNKNFGFNSVRAVSAF